MSPRSRRTHLPPLRSMAGRTIIVRSRSLVARAVKSASRRPARRVRPPDGRSSRGSAARRAWLFSGWNWQAKTLSRAIAEVNSIAVVGRGRDQRRVRRNHVVRVHEVDEGAVGDAVAGAATSRCLRTGSSPCAGPAKSGRRARESARTRPRKTPSPAHRAELLALLEQQLHAEADAEKRRAALDDARAPRRPARRSRRFSMQAPKAPTPGNTTPAAALDALRRRASPRPRSPTRSRPFCTLRRLPMP